MVNYILFGRFMEIWWFCWVAESAASDYDIEQLIAIGSSTIDRNDWEDFMIAGASCGKRGRVGRTILMKMVLFPPLRLSPL